MTERQKQQTALAHFEAWRRSCATSLDEVYGSYSSAKASSFALIQCEAQDLLEVPNVLSVSAVYIISHNIMMYTCGYIYEEELPNGDTVVKFVYHTPSYRIEVDVTNYYD